MFTVCERYQKLNAFRNEYIFNKIRNEISITFCKTLTYLTKHDKLFFYNMVIINENDS